MHKQIFVNLPCRSLPRAKAFYEALGYQFNPQFTNDKGACLVLGDNLFAMLLAEDFFKSFTAKPIADARQSTEVLVCLSCDSRAEVDGLVKKALAAGGTAPRAPQDHGFMYGRSFADPDNHIWEVMWMDPAVASGEKAPGE